MEYSSKLKGILEEIKKTEASDIYIDLSDKDRAFPLLSSSGSVGLDIAMGGGIPKAAIIEIYGPEHSGKTTIALHSIIEYQKLDKANIAAFIDVEHSFSHTYFENLGGTLDQLLFFQPNTAEQCLNVIEKLAYSGEVQLIVLDSVAALVSEAETKAETGDLKLGLIARFMSAHMRKVVASSKQETTIIYINQLREKIGVIYGSPEVTTGGKALKFYSSIRLDVRRKGTEKHQEDGKDIHTAAKTKVKVVKNKVAAPFKVAEFNIEFGTGISRISEIVDVALTLGVLEKRSAGIFPNYDSLFWTEEKIESTANYATEILQEPEFKALYEEIYTKVKIELKQITEAEAKKYLEELFKTEKVKYDIYDLNWDLGSKASLSSKHIEAYHHLKLAYEALPYRKECETKFKAVVKRIEERLDKGELQESKDWNIEVNKKKIDVSKIWEEKQ